MDNIEIEGNSCNGKDNLNVSKTSDDTDFNDNDGNVEEALCSGFGGDDDHNKGDGDNDCGDDIRDVDDAPSSTDNELIMTIFLCWKPTTMITRMFM